MKVVYLLLFMLVGLFLFASAEMDMGMVYSERCDDITLQLLSNETDTVEWNQSQTISTEDEPFSIKKVYPNPVRDIINIEIEATKETRVAISLINIAGIEVKRWDNKSLHRGINRFNYDINEHIQGVYILKITGKENIKTSIIKKL